MLAEEKKLQMWRRWLMIIERAIARLEHEPGLTRTTRTAEARRGEDASTILDRDITIRVFVSCETAKYKSRAFSRLQACDNHF
jgi:hypothetical protein